MEMLNKITPFIFVSSISLAIGWILGFFHATSLTGKAIRLLDEKIYKKTGKRPIKEILKK